MTVGKLLDILKDCDPKLDVVFVTDEGGFCIAEPIKGAHKSKDRIALV